MAFYSGFIPLVFSLLLLLFLVDAIQTTRYNKTCVGEGDGGSPLSVGSYITTCPGLEPIVFYWVHKAVATEPRMAASLLRLHFHDCFVNGCDASVLLDDGDGLEGEKRAGPNQNSLRGFEVIDAIKSDLETVCPDTVSCADILSIVARDAVLLSGGPGWEVVTGRRDSLDASKATANNNLPAPNSNVQTLIAKFTNVGLTMQDMVALSGAHTIGNARCQTFISRFNKDTHSGGGDITNVEFRQSVQALCSNSNNAALAQLDRTTPVTFDNQYYINLVAKEGLLGSDQVLFDGDDNTRAIVETYASDIVLFFEDFRRSMIKMGNLRAPPGAKGEIRKNCRRIN